MRAAENALPASTLQLTNKAALPIIRTHHLFLHHAPGGWQFLYFSQPEIPGGQQAFPQTIEIFVAGCPEGTPGLKLVAADPCGPRVVEDGKGRRMVKHRSKPKRKGYGLEVRTFSSLKDDKEYLVFKTPEGSFHVYEEVEAKQAGKRCGGKGQNTRQIWDSIWDEPDND